MIAPWTERPEDWFTMFARESKRIREIYQEVCVHAGVTPTRAAFNAMLDAAEKEMVDATAAALGMARYDTEVEIAAKRIVWRRSPAPYWHIETRCGDGPWTRLALPDLLKPNPLAASASGRW